MPRNSTIFLLEVDREDARLFREMPTRYASSDMVHKANRFMSVKRGIARSIKEDETKRKGNRIRGFAMNTRERKTMGTNASQKAML